MDDEIPDFGPDDAAPAVPAVPAHVHMDCKGRAYEVGQQVRSIHNLSIAVVTDVSDPRGVWLVYDDDDHAIRMDGRHVEILDVPKRTVMPKTAVSSQESDDIPSEDDLLRADLEAAREEVEQTSDAQNLADADGLDEETFFGADEGDDAVLTNPNGVESDHETADTSRPGIDNAEPYEDPPREITVAPTLPSAPGYEPAPEAPMWQIFCGDGPSGLLSLAEVDHVFSDVPFSKAVDDGNEADNTRGNSFDFAPMTAELMERIAQAIGMRCRRWCIIKTSDDEVHAWCEALQRAGMFIYRIGHWVREGTKPQMDGTGPAQAVEYLIIAHGRYSTQRWNGGGKRALWFAPIVHKEYRRHPTHTPPQLLRQLFEDFTDPGDLIADLTAGSFESGIVAVSMGRRYVGWDINQHYVDEARELFKMPLFDNSPLQADLFATPRASTRAARLRADTERDILRAIKAKPGIKVSEIMQQIGVQDRSEVTRPLARMRKKLLVRQEGKTAGASYFPFTLAEQQQRDEAARAAAAAAPPSPEPALEEGSPS